MKNVRELGKEIRKDMPPKASISSETVTIRVTTDEKKRLKRLASACKLSQTQLVKHLIAGAELRAIPPEELYLVGQQIALIAEIILEYRLEDQPIREQLEILRQIMEDFLQKCSQFYDEGIFGAAYERTQRDFLSLWETEFSPYNEGEAV